MSHSPIQNTIGHSVVGWELDLSAPRMGPMPIIVMVAAGLDLLILGVAHLLIPEVNPLTRPTSDYALGRIGWLTLIGTLAVGIGAIALAIAWRRHPLLAVVIGVFGVAKIAQPFFLADAFGAPATTTGTVHDVLSKLAFYSLPLASVLLVQLRWKSGSALPMLGAFALVFFMFGMGVVSPHGYFGLAQRAYLITCSLWMIGAARASTQRASAARVSS